ncbi:Pol polyprotein [Cricetulus griseus]|nr:Pol polyprotein [Cricetulus griseus]
MKKLLRPTSSPFKNPILAVKIPNGTYHLVQDLRLINSAVVPLHPVVPNPYTLLSTIPPATSHFSVLDLKDAFFSIPLHTQSQNIFAFTWTDPDTHASTQLTWTVLPQGFWDSPHLASDLLSLSFPKSKFIPQKRGDDGECTYFCLPSDLQEDRMHSAKYEEVSGVDLITGSIAFVFPQNLTSVDKL